MLPQLFVNGLIAGSIYALVALGFGLIYATTRFFHFAHGAVYTAGAYLAYSGWLLGLSLWVAIPRDQSGFEDHYGHRRAEGTGSPQNC